MVVVAFSLVYSILYGVWYDYRFCCWWWYSLPVLNILHAIVVQRVYWLSLRFGLVCGLPWCTYKIQTGWLDFSCVVVCVVSVCRVLLLDAFPYYWSIWMSKESLWLCCGKFSKPASSRQIEQHTLPALGSLIHGTSYQILRWPSGRNPIHIQTCTDN